MLNGSMWFFVLVFGMVLITYIVYGVLLALAVFGVRCAVTLPVFFLLAVPAWGNSAALALASLGRGRRTAPIVYGRTWWLRVAICAGILLAGMCMDLFFSQWLLQAVLGRILV